MVSNSCRYFTSPKTTTHASYSVAENPPGKDLTPEECERVVVALLVEGVLKVRVKFNAYDGAVYMLLGPPARGLAASPKPSVVMNFPKKEAKKRAAETNKANARKSVADEDGWLSAKKPARKKGGRSDATSVATKKKATSKKATTTRKRKQSAIVKEKQKASKKRNSKSFNNDAAFDIIELSSSEDEPEPEPVASSRAALPRAARTSSSMALQDDLWDEPATDSDEECEFDG